MSKPGIAKPEHEIAYDRLAALFKEMADQHGLTSLELLAVAANAVGKLIAMQDQRHVSPDRAMRIVANNMQVGNQQVLDSLKDVKGTG